MRRFEICNKARLTADRVERWTRSVAWVVQERLWWCRGARAQVRRAAGAADEVQKQFMLGGIFEIGEKFGSCWSEVILVIIKVKY